MNTLFQSEIWEKFHAPNATRINGKLFIKHPLPFGLHWLECPMAEVKKEDVDAIKQFQILPVFIRFNPAIEKNLPYTAPENSRKIKNSHFPQATIIIDLTQSKEEILAQMKQKGRYNIKIAKKNNVSIQNLDSKNPDFLDTVGAFYELLKKTATRDKFHIHPKSHYEKMLRALGENHTKLFTAKYNNQIIAAAIVTFYSDTATYYYGASDHDLRHLMTPYLLHWEIMRYARACGYKKYDLFGIAPNEAKNHPWSGVTEFKKKFGGKYVEYHEPREIVLQPFWYRLYKMAKFFTRLFP